MNFVSTEELVANLNILLDIFQNTDAGEDVQFPMEEEMYELICKMDDSSIDKVENAVSNDDKRSYEPLEPLAVIWDEADRRYWCIGFYIRDLNEDEIQVDHLKCNRKEKFVEWVRPEQDDVQSVHIIQLLSVKVDGTWYFHNQTQPVCRVNNVKYIEAAFSVLMED